MASESMKSKAGVDEQRETNFLNDGKGSAQTKYYEFKLRQEKLAAIGAKGVEEGWLSEEEKDALGTVSDKEKLEMKVLGRLYQLNDTSADYLQVKTITGSDSREEIASKLADIYYKKYITDDILARFVDPASTRRSILLPSAQKSRAAFTAFGAGQ
jgi:hypothetical protein